MLLNWETWEWEWGRGGEHEHKINQFLRKLGVRAERSSLGLLVVRNALVAIVRLSLHGAVLALPLFVREFLRGGRTVSMLKRQKSKREMRFKREVAKDATSKEKGREIERTRELNLRAWAGGEHLLLGSHLRIAYAHGDNLKQRARFIVKSKKEE